MTIESVTKPEVPYTEAPASWNVSYITPEGFICNDSAQAAEIGG